MTPERQLEDHLIEILRGLKYEYRADIRDRAALEKNFREKFESLNHVKTHKQGLMQQLFPGLQESVSPRPGTPGRGLTGKPHLLAVLPSPRYSGERGRGEGAE